MKKIIRTIAIILVLIMIANSFSGCTLLYLSAAINGNVNDNNGEGLLLCLGIDCTLIFVSILVGVVVLLTHRGGYAGVDTIDSLSEEEYISLMEKVDSLPEEELASLIRSIDSMPEAEKASFIEKINSLSDEEFASLVSAFTSAPETEIISSMHRINSFNEPQFSSFVNVLQHIEVGFSPDNRAYLGVHFRY
ncbi:MAG: hypothetical protein LBI28_11860 [Treponema sp.]|jgi:hypothetical protein|nr:hypothetical protein [Treponema sp.]